MLFTVRYKTKTDDVSTSFMTEGWFLVAPQTEECTIPELSKEWGNTERNAAATLVPR